jgi:hypothetical protein
MLAIDAADLKAFKSFCSTSFSAVSGFFPFGFDIAIILVTKFLELINSMFSPTLSWGASDRNFENVYHLSFTFMLFLPVA